MPEEVTSVEMSEAAEPTAGEATESAEVVEDSQGEQSVEAEAAPRQTTEEDSKYAAARRAAEQQTRAERQAREQLDNQFAAMFGQYKNPMTGQPIRSAQEYLSAMQAQMSQQNAQQLQKAGLDPNLIDRAVAMNPTVQQAQQIIQQQTQAEANRMMQADLQAIVDLDPSLGSVQDVFKTENFQRVIDTVRSSGLHLVDAYKLVNFERLSKVQAEKAEQAAINQSKGKAHLAAAQGVSGKSDGEDIPEHLMPQYRKWFPDKSNKELRALYNKQLKETK